MKILHVIPTLSSLAGGPTEVAINLVKHLNTLGAQAEIVTTDDDGNNRFNVPINEVTTFREVPVRFFPRISPRMKEFIISPSAVSWLSSNMGKYDILDTHYLFSFVPLVARSIARKRKFPYTVRTMGQLSPWALQQNRYKKQLFFKLQELKNLKEADALHSTSIGEESDIRTFGLTNSVINIPLGVERPDIILDASIKIKAKYKIDPKAFVILFLSRLHPKKRPELMVEIVSHLKAQYNVHLIIAGAGDKQYEHELKEKVREQALTNSVTFAGFVSGYEKEELLQGADVFALPSFSENFGVAVAESLAAGTPVVITPDVQISEYVEKYQAGVIAKGDINSFRLSLIQCIENKKMMIQFKQNGIALVDECFNWKTIAAELLKNYQEVLNNLSKR